MYYFIYQITNLINGKIYVGAHKSTTLNDNYLGSGIHICRAVRKYGKENFTRTIVEQFNNSTDMYLRESEIVDDEFLTRKDVYNKMKGGKGGWDHWNAIETSESKKRKGQLAVEYKKGIHANGYDKGVGGRIGGKITGPTTKDRRWFTNGIEDTRVHIDNIESFKITHSSWYEGRTCKPTLGVAGKTGNTIWVSKDGQRKRIKASELETFIRLGYSEGMGSTNWNPLSSHKKP